MKKKLIALLLSATMVFSLIGCSSSSQTAADSSNNDAAGTSESAATESTVDSASKTLIVGLQGDPSSFNPDGTPDDWEFFVCENLYSRLVKLNWKGECVPDLAESWDISDDGLTYTFHLADGVKWHDGEDCTSADVKWTFDTIMNESGYLISYLGNVKSIDAPDATTVVFNLNAPDASLLTNLSFLGSFILPQHLYDGQDWLTCEAATSAPVGTGPFKFSDYQQGVNITLEANPDYFNGAPQVGKLVYQIIPDSNTAVQAYNNGELDILGVMVPSAQVDALESDENTKVVYNANFGRYYYGFNFNSEALQSKEVREAITIGINRQEIVDKAYGKTGKLAEGYYTPAVDWAFNADAKIPDFDKEKAEQLLQQAGLTKNSDGYYLTLSIATFNLDPFTNVATIMQANLKEIGIDLQINTMEAAAFMQLGMSGEGYDLYAMGGQVGPDPSSFYHRIATDGMMNFSHYSNAEVDDSFAQASGIMDQTERGDLYKKIQEYCAEDFIIVPFSEDNAVNVYKSYLSGLPYDENVDSCSMDEMSKVSFNAEP